MNKKIIVLITCILIGGVYAIYFWSNLPGEYDDFAKCLSEKEITMAGTDWCHFCNSQKEKFGKSFKYIDYKNCDLNKVWCSSFKIERYPTWILKNGDKLEGVQELSELSEVSGCSLNI